MNRPWHTWLAFGACLAVVLVAMGWISRTVLRLERVEEQSRRQANQEENVRLALWRMDSALAPLIAQESVQPYFAYGAFYPIDHAYTQMFGEIKKGELLAPSPLLKQPSPHSLLHFQFDGKGELTSPQVPPSSKKALATVSCATTESLLAFSERLRKFHELVDGDKLSEQLPVLEDQYPAVAYFEDNSALNGAPNYPGNSKQVTLPPQNDAGQQVAQMAPDTQQLAQSKERQQWQRSQNEYEKRAQNRQQQSDQIVNWSNSNLSLNKPIHGADDVRQGPLTPLWIGSALVLARRVRIGNESYMQGCWLDWPDIQSWLKGQVADLLPNAAFEPLTDDPGDRPTNLLAALPVRLVPGAIPEESSPLLSPMRLSLLVAWVCVLLAAGAVAALLMGAMGLSERRGAFVSAVTHELRTPLTTFRMYTEMLSEQMVSDEATRRKYLDTLRVEADRLSHLVENVLAYARLERGRIGGHIEETTWADVLAKVTQRLSERAAQAGMTLQVEPPAGGAAIRTDTSAVEQILFNLVDNACKYAASAADRRIHLEASGTGLRIRDHGPGFSKLERRKLFQPFSKSARQAAHSAPGVGLGLALSRRLARQMGGDLQLESAGGGASFLLTACPAL